jgi:hypothetical protein
MRCDCPTGSARSGNWDGVSGLTQRLDLQWSELLPSNKNEELFELLVESSPDFAIFTMDRSGASWNVGAERQFGRVDTPPKPK